MGIISIAVFMLLLEVFLMKEAGKYKEIHLAGGCFWGVEKYFSVVPGVIETDVGYANGDTENPSYDEVCFEGTGHAEAVRVKYDPNTVSLSHILSLYFEVIDPTAVNRQGMDIGKQYRTGIYYTHVEDEKIIRQAIAKLQEKYKAPIAIEVEPLKNYYLAEEQHQAYLEKYPAGYCHIGHESFEKAKNSIVNPMDYDLPEDQELRSSLTDMQYKVVKQNATEPPFKNEYWDHFAPGIYVDIATGEPIFTWKDKFESDSGWPSFSDVIDPSVVYNKNDLSHGMIRREVRSRVGDTHLGHVFKDGPKEDGGLRYCINSAAIRFIEKDKMEEEGYGKYIPFIE